MKKLLIISLITLCVPVIASEYACTYEENGTYYSFGYIPGQTVEDFCGNRVLDKNTPAWVIEEHNKCVSEGYPRAIRAFKSGACKKIMPPKVYSNVEGCECQVTYLEDGTRYSTSCSGSNVSTSCNTGKAMKKMEWMLYDKK